MVDAENDEADRRIFLLANIDNMIKIFENISIYATHSSFLIFLQLAILY